MSILFLFYFRFRVPRYYGSRRDLISLETVSLHKSALEEKEFGWLRKSSVAEQLRDVSRL